jgi:RND family efflux transporter MFP subunit
MSIQFEKLKSPAHRLGALLAIGAVIALPACGKKAEEKPAGGTAPAAAGGEAATAGALVTVAKVETGTIEEHAEVTGSLVALQDVIVGNKIAGRVASVFVREGDQVVAGQLVAQMDASDTQAQVGQAEANLQSAITRQQQAETQLLQAKSKLINAQTTAKWTEKTTANSISLAKTAISNAKERLSVVRQGARQQERAQADEQVKTAKANYDKARSDLKRYQQLYRDEAISASQLDQAQAAFESAQAQLNSAQQAVSLLKEGARPEEIRQAELGVQTAEEQLSRAVMDQDTVTLRKQDIRNEQAAVEVAQSAIKTAKAGVDQARSALRLAQNQVGDTRVISPISGYVAKRMAEPGQQLGGGGQIMQIVSPESVYFEATISETQYSQTRLGQTVDVTVDALPNVKFNGKITRVLPVASSSARTFQLRVDLSVKDARLRPQMFARGQILVARRSNATLLPKDALVIVPGSDPKVFVVKDGAATEKTLKVGITTPSNVEVLSGISAGESVITAGGTGLQSGDKVRVAAPVSGASTAEHPATSGSAP